MSSQKRYLFLAIAIFFTGLLATWCNYLAGNLSGMLAPGKQVRNKQEVHPAGTDKAGRAFELAYITIDKDMYHAIVAKDSIRSGEFLYPVFNNEISGKEVNGNAANEAGMRRLLAGSYGPLVLRERTIACLLVKCIGQATTYHCFLEAEKTTTPPMEMLGPGWLDTGFDENGNEDTVTHDLTYIGLGKMRMGEGLFIPLFMLYGYGASNESYLTASAVSGIVYNPKFIRYYDDNGDTVRINIAPILEKPLLLHSN